MRFFVDDDFDLEKIAESGQCFRWEKADEQTYRIPAGNRCLYISALGDGWFEADCSENEFDLFWREYFDLGENYRDIRKRVDPELDPFLHIACESEKGIRILRQDPWETLISFIISQNKNIPAIRRSITLLCEACGESKTDNKGQRFYAFPSPSALLALDDTALKECRLGYRCDYVHKAAAAVCNEEIDIQKLLYEKEKETIRVLTGLYGVGVKVASCVSLFGLHHMDAFPVDVWIRRILANEYPGGYPLEKYAPYNGVYQQYMFAYYRNRDLQR